MTLKLGSMAARLSKVERALACELCALRDEFTAHVRELETLWGIPPEKCESVGTFKCEWCGVPVQVKFSGAEVKAREAFERMDALFWQGRLCAPEYQEAKAAAFGSIEAEVSARYAGHVEEFAEARAEYGRQIEAIRQPPLPYLCRVPGCKCAYPKTLAECRANLRARGVKVSARGFGNATHATH